MSLRRPLSLVGFAVAAAVVATVPAFADSVSLVSVADNTLYQNANGSLSNGAGSGMFAGRTAQLSDQIRRAVVRFDMSAIPAGSTITSVSLRVYSSMTTPGDVQQTLHAVLVSWGEGTSVAPSGQGGGTAATANDATWRHRFFPGILWASLGGEFIAFPQSSVVVGDVGFYTFPTSGPFVAVAQDQFDHPATNFGWMIRGDEVLDGTAKRYATKEYPLNENRPTLIVEYTPPGVPAEAVTWGAVKSLYR